MIEPEELPRLQVRIGPLVAAVILPDCFVQPDTQAEIEQRFSTAKIMVYFQDNVIFLIARERTNPEMFHTLGAAARDIHWWLHGKGLVSATEPHFDSFNHKEVSLTDNPDTWPVI